MSRRFFSVLLSVIGAFMCMFSLVSCGGDESEAPQYGEAYTGKISELYYDTEEDAVKAFLHNELDCIEEYTMTDGDGNVTASTTRVIFKADYVSHEKLATVSETESESFGLSVADIADLSSIERVAITFAPTSPEAEFIIQNMPALQQTVTQKAILLRYSDGRCRYFTPLPENGELLTRSYFEDVLDERKYGNCTVNINYESYGDNSKGETVVIHYTDVTEKYTAENTYLKRAERTVFTASLDKQVLEQLYASSINAGIISKSEIDRIYELFLQSPKPYTADKSEMEQYEIKHGDNFVTVGVDEEECEVIGTSSAIGTLERRRLATLVCGNEFTTYYAYPFTFVKTNYGFVSLDMGVIRPQFPIITVRDGKLHTVTINKSEKFFGKFTVKFTDIGSTSVVVSDEIRAAVDAA